MKDKETEFNIDYGEEIFTIPEKDYKNIKNFLMCQ
jgi:hypothetical protein